MIYPNALGLIFPNAHEAGLPELVAHRTMASVPFGGRYRMIDFCLSGMANAGMENIGVIARKNYQSLMDHLGNGREWDLSRKRGGLIIFPPFARDGGTVYTNRIESVASVADYLSYQKEGLVVMCDCDVVFNLDFRDLLRTHRTSGADVTMVYQQGRLEEGMSRDNVTVQLDDEGFVTQMRINDFRRGEVNLSMNVFVIGREYLLDLTRESMVQGGKGFEHDFLLHNLHHVRVKGYEYTDYSARIYDMFSYFNESMRLIDPASLAALFPEERPIYTKVRDEAPVRYAIDSRVNCCLVADGCIIEGEIDHCVIFRGVRVGKGARLKNCIIMQGSEIEQGADLENVITDKNVRVRAGQKLRGTSRYPVYIAKNSVVD